MNTKWYTYLALLFAGWFALTSWIWAWMLNIFFSYPFGLVALLLYFIGRKTTPGNRLNKVVLILLGAGWGSSIIAAMLLR